MGFTTCKLSAPATRCKPVVHLIVVRRGAIRPLCGDGGGPNEHHYVVTDEPATCRRCDKAGR
jgi:hypothetical protein